MSMISMAANVIYTTMATTTNGSFYNSPTFPHLQKMMIHVPVSLAKNCMYLSLAGENQMVRFTCTCVSYSCDVT